MKKIEEQTKPLLLQLKQEKAKKDSIKECKYLFCGAETKPLQDVKQGKYEVNAAKKSTVGLVNSTFSLFRSLMGVIKLQMILTFGVIRQLKINYKKQKI